MGHSFFQILGEKSEYAKEFTAKQQVYEFNQLTSVFLSLGMHLDEAQKYAHQCEMANIAYDKKMEKEENG